MSDHLAIPFARAVDAAKAIVAVDAEGLGPSPDGKTGFVNVVISDTGNVTFMAEL